ncbi:ATP-binding protein [Bifidobacterium sp. ESL0790]|uniref:ATP-binding protein n=1 Tax=Bifidobacterium sp. ESL0790 TaxID=2983233 RepID=UPI0023F7EECE|nr:ATP-binding protein [Bifidobacterium sp. ESL0790]WEV72055.1 PspC domain-containing protein [Bifidobacterium sp. ESL0790]
MRPTNRSTRGQQPGQPYPDSSARGYGYGPNGHSSNEYGRYGYQGNNYPGQSAFPAPVRQRLPLLRPKNKRMLCGVCRGLSLHLGIPVAVIRMAFIALTFLFGSGIAAYIFLWVFVPAGDPVAVYQAQQQASQGPLARGNLAYPGANQDFYGGNAGYQNGADIGSSNSNIVNPAAEAGIDNHQDERRCKREEKGNRQQYGHPENTPQNSSADAGADDGIGSFEDIGQALKRASKPSLIALAGLALVILAILLTASPIPADLTVGVLMALCGIGVAWLKMNAARGQLPYLIAGIILLAAGYIVCTDSTTFQFHLPFSAMVAGLALLAGVGVALVPLGNKLTQDLGRERALKEREEERADMTAHLHDGVLQTLALIQLHSDEPQTVFTLARGQERELRRWLYQDRTPPDRSVSAGLHEIAARIEDEYRKPIEVVAVGDARPSAQTDALLNASEQAMLNAVQHGGEPISVYCETGGKLVEVFVRDHGDGFDVDAIPEDRLGIRESIMGRIKRRGGSVEIVSRPQWGTEVRMHMPISQEHCAADDIMASERGTGDADE